MHRSDPDNDLLDANTVFFRLIQAGKVVSQPLHLPSRAHAEIVFLLSQHGICGFIPLPPTEQAAQALHRQIAERLAAISAKAGELAASRTADEKKALEISRLLQSWMVRGKPVRN